MGDTLAAASVGRYTVAWEPSSGLSVAIDNVPFVRQSTLYLVKAGWTGVLFDQRTVKPTVTDWQTATDGSRTARISLENENAVCAYTLSLVHRDTTDTLDVTLSYRLKKDVPTEIEYAAGYLSGPILADAALSGNAGGDPIPLTEVAVAPPPVGNTQAQNRLSPPFTDITLATRLGPLQIVSDGSAPRPVIFDARSDPQDWAQAFPVFWLGIGSPSQPVRFADGERVAHLRFVLSPSSSAPQVGPAEPGTSVTRSPIRPDAYLPTASQKPLVIPTPKQLTIRSDVSPFRLSAATRIVRCDDTAGTLRAVTLLQQAIQEQYGLRLPIVKQTALPTNAAKNVLYVGVTGRSPLLGSKNVTVPQKPEGYGIRFPYIAGRDEAGVLWAVQTVRQLLATDATGPLLPAVVVSDWPTLAIRGVHLFHGQNALPFHEKLIDRILSPFKMNTLLIQAEQVRWQHDPSVAPSWAGTPAQIRQEVAFARAHGMTVYPLVQNYGHMEWLFQKPQNREFAEDPEIPYAVNFTNPTAVKYLEGFDTEADTVFDAPAFHIGLDEVIAIDEQTRHERGRFPYRSAPRTFADLFVSAATHWHDFLARRGKETWMWADMALHPSEVAPAFGTAPSAKDAQKVREGLPKDIVMVDWQYSPLDRYPSLQILKRSGFKKVIAATWADPNNIRGFSRAAAEAGAWGALQTTWCGYESSEAVLDTPERRQFTAMVLAAEYFWNGGGPAPDKLPYDPADVFAREWRGPDPAARKTRAGWTLNLNPIGDRPLEDFIGFGPQNRPVGLSAGTVRLADNTVYEIAERSLVLFGKLNPFGAYPTEATIPTRAMPDAPARTIRLLMAASHRADRNTPLGKIVITLTDGTTTETSLIYAKNIASWEDKIGLPDVPIVWRGETSYHLVACLRALSLVAPQGKAIQSLRLISEGRESAPIVFAATALE